MTELPVGVITNGSPLYLPEVRDELVAADAVLPALAQWASADVQEAVAALQASGRAQVVVRHRKRFWAATDSYFPDLGSERGRVKR
jgi:hypothetical protein